MEISSSINQEELKTVQLLAKDVLEMYEPPLTAINAHLKELTSSSINQEEVKTIQLLAKGVLELYEPPLSTVNTHLKELTEKQDAVHNMLQSERRKLEDVQNDATLDALLADIATNREKLVSISNTMMSLHKRVQSLQTRAANIEKAAKNRVTSPTRATTS